MICRVKSNRWVSRSSAESQGRRRVHGDRGVVDGEHDPDHIAADLDHGRTDLVDRDPEVVDPVDVEGDQRRHARGGEPHDPDERGIGGDAELHLGGWPSSPPSAVHRTIGPDRVRSDRNGPTLWVILNRSALDQSAPPADRPRRHSSTRRIHPLRRRRRAVPAPFDDRRRRRRGARRHRSGVTSADGCHRSALCGAWASWIPRGSSVVRGWVGARKAPLGTLDRSHGAGWSNRRLRNRFRRSPPVVEQLRRQVGDLPALVAGPPSQGVERRHGIQARSVP